MKHLKPIGSKGLLALRVYVSRLVDPAEPLLQAIWSER